MTAIDTPAVVASFRALREAWFLRAMKFQSHERECESEDACRRRCENNERMKRQYDKQTSQLLAGSPVPMVAPTCWADLDKTEIEP